jgi:Glyoxalase-like domain
LGYLRLRQICLVAGALEPALDDIGNIFGLTICYRDGNVAKYGLVNALFPIGTSFLEVVAPTRAGTAAGRYLERRGGDGGYMVILDCHDIERRRRHVAEIGVRVANPLQYETYTGLQLHPRDTGGALLEFNHTQGGERLEGAYHPAGPNWQSAVRRDVTVALTGAVLQSADPAALAARWGRIVERPVSSGASDELQITLDGGRLRFVAARDGRGEGLAGVDLDVADRSRILEEARRRGHATVTDAVIVCGTRFHLDQRRV